MLLAQVAEATTPAAAEVAVFFVLAAIALGSAIAVITMRNIVHAALMLVLNLLAIAGLFLALGSAFLSVIQILVYAGAIVVLFLFVIMLLGIARDDLLQAGSPRTIGLAVAGVALLAGALLVGIVGPFTGPDSICDRGARSGAGGACVGLEDSLAAEPQGSVSFIGNRLFTRHTYAFELTAILLTVATVGATVAGRRKDPPSDDEVEFAPTSGEG